MLNACHGEWDRENAYGYTPHSLDELRRLVDRLAAARPVSSYPGGASGDHAWILVSDHGFDLSVYFGEGCREDGVVRFELYGPYTPGDRGDIYDGRGVAGDMTTACLMGLLALLDGGHSPVASVWDSAREVSVVTD